MFFDVSFKKILVSMLVIVSANTVHGSDFRYPSVSVVLVGDISEVKGLKEKLADEFGKNDECKSDIKEENADFMLYVEGHSVDEDTQVLSYTFVQPFRESALFRILGLPGTLGDSRKDRYVNSSRIYLGGWVSTVSGYNANDLSRKICLDYSREVEVPSVENYEM